MKRLFIICYVFALHISMFSQIYKVPYKGFLVDQMPTYILAQYHLDVDGIYNLMKDEDGYEITYDDYKKYTEGWEHFFCYDKKKDYYYFYTDNTVGFIHPIQSNHVKRIKTILKDNGVKEIESADCKITVTRIIDEIIKSYNAKNDSIAENKNNIEMQTAKLKEEYRKSHNWHKLSLDKPISFLCGYCKDFHKENNFYVLSINNDTIYYTLEKEDFSMLGYKLSLIHYTNVSTHFSNNNVYNYYVDIWKDSLDQYNSLTNIDADKINIFRYGKFINDIRMHAPNGFISNWGWNLNYADGIEPYFSYYNTSEKTIKYVDFYFSMYNAVGDKCYLKYDNSYIGKIRGVGPIEPMDSGVWNWDRATHYTSGDATDMRIVKIVLTYMDNTKLTLSGKSIIYR